MHDEDRKQFAIALHEAGHAALLPPGGWTHTSLLPVSICPACLSEGESADLMDTLGQSSGHTLFGPPGLGGMQNFLYTLAGGAAEVACGKEPELTQFDGIGEYPTGMSADFEVLRTDLEHYQSGTLRDYSVELRKWFEIAVEHLRPHTEKMCAIAEALVEKRVIKSC